MRLYKKEYIILIGIKKTDLSNCHKSLNLKIFKFPKDFLFFP